MVGRSALSRVVNQQRCHGLGDAYQALFGPADMGSAQSATPVTPGVIGDADRDLYGNFAQEPSADDIAPGGIGDAYKAPMASDKDPGASQAQLDASIDDIETANIGDELAQTWPPSPRYPDPIRAEARSRCVQHRISTLPMTMRPDWRSVRIKEEAACNDQVFEARTYPGSVILRSTFKDGTTVVIPADGRPPYILPRDR